MGKPHGKATVDWTGHIMEVRSIGSFNEDGTDIFLKKMYAAADERISELPFWQRLDILSFESLGGPEVMKMTGRSYLWCFKNGCNAIATVYATQLQKAILLNFVEETQANMKGFKTRAEALEWLSEEEQIHIKKSASL